jgi:hypothetical protein
MIIQLFNQLSRVTHISGSSDVSPIELQYSTYLSKNALHDTLYRNELNLFKREGTVDPEFPQDKTR